MDSLTLRSPRCAARAGGLDLGARPRSLEFAWASDGLADEVLRAVRVPEDSRRFAYHHRGLSAYLLTIDWGKFTPVEKTLGSTERLSRARVRALSILHPEYALEPELFALYMWPASPSWRGASPGRGACLKARGFLARLRAEGLADLRAIARDAGEGYVVTPEGERLAIDPARVASATT